MDNDTRGWIMCLFSGLACVLGASIICVDLIIRHLPSKRDFHIQDSDVFLAASLSLSFGVMIFSALFGMLPSAKKYLMRESMSASTASWVLMLCFVLGFLGIQVVSRFLHQYIPSHVVDCDHVHEDDADDHGTHKHSTAGAHSHGAHSHPAHDHDHDGDDHDDAHKTADETSPLLTHENGRSRSLGAPQRRDGTATPKSRRPSHDSDRRQSIKLVQSRVMSFVADTKANCDESGPCFGYTEPCGHQCYRHTYVKAKQGLRRQHTDGEALGQSACLAEEPLPETDDESLPSPGLARHVSDLGSTAAESDLEAQHHHHVPENAFLSIGLQTSIAIALHKLPEGFITYATNHANPSLGFAVFLALSIHNIAEGFAMALPLYLALNSRLRAMLWSSLLGGLSQPVGAGIAALWFHLTRDQTPGYVVYGCMFAATAGIMTSVALQLFVESLSLTHRQGICIAFAFIGMTILGISNALTGDSH